MTSTKIYKIFYTDSSNNTKILGYLNNLTKINPGLTGPNINGSISLYDFTNMTIQDSYIYLTNAEYTPSIYAIGFWFSINGNGSYTLLNILSPDYKLTVFNNSLYDSLNTFNVALTNVYNMCALIFEGNKLTKVVVNDNIYPLANSITILNIIGSVGISLGNDNNMRTKFNGYIGEIQLLNVDSFIGGIFDIDTLYSKLKYKKTIITTTQPVTTTTQPVTTTTQPVTTTTSQPGTTTTTQPVTTTTQPVTTTTQPVTTTTQPIIDANEDGLKIIPATTPQITVPTTTTTTTSYIPTTTMSPLEKNTAQLIKL